MTGITLIVDDSLTVREDLVDAFFQAGLLTVGCGSLAEARSHLANQTFGLIILDVILPDGDGVDLLKEIRAMQPGADIPVLMLSTEAEVQDRIRGLITGSNDYVGKPYDLEYVITRARQLLNQNVNPPPQPTKARVLLIDDSVTFRERLSELLHAQGFDVQTAESGEEGLRSAAANRPDAVVVDEILPGIDGSTVIRKLRMDVVSRQTPCILLTGSRDQHAELRALESGADTFVRKEEDLDVILARIIAVLRNIRSTGLTKPSTVLHKPKKVLAVDDSMTYLHELGEALSGEGYDVILARSGEEALEMIAVQAVDCILLDRLMPGLGGMETCRRIKETPAWRDIPLIMLTAMEDREAMIEGLSTGADDYVLKSNELDVLKARLRAQLRRKHFEDESQRVRAELMTKELEIAEARAANELFESRATLLSVLEQKNQDLGVANSELLARQEEIADKNQQLEKASRHKSEFLSNMSHELRSPLNAILGLAYLLEQSPLDRDAKEMVRKIRTSGRSLLGIINDVLDVSKIEAGHMIIEHIPFRLDDVLEKIGNSMSIAAGDKDIELIIQALPAGISSVIGDALRLEQVLVNLTSNAIKFTNAGQIELSSKLVSRQDEQITLHFSVKDTGIGIAAEAQKNVFSPFTQADTSTTRRFGGTGLGLTICRQLVELMGGEIGLVSTPGVGSEFWFTLPFYEIADTTSFSQDVTRLDILVADDNPIALHAIVMIAQSLGWYVRATDSGQTVLSQLLGREHSQLPDVVILDWKMPGLDGLATARALRDGLPPENCPILILATAYSHSSLAIPSGSNIIDAILNKPLTASTLYNAVLEAQRRRNAQASTSQPAQQHASRELENIRVLVVDDSEINREVAQLILLENGAIVTLAVDGKNAVDCLLAHPDDFDIILMDVQMPVMDGIDATKQLRSMPQFQSIPIVALTAGAFKSQQDAAYAAGMTDFISKPFDVPSTITLIRRLVGNSVSAVTARQDRLQSQQIHGSVIPSSDLAVIDVTRGLTVWSDIRIYRHYLHRFADSYGNAITMINASLAADDWHAAASLAHKLGGAAGNLAMSDTHRLAAEAERVLTAGYDPTQALDRLSDALEQALSAIRLFTLKVESQLEITSPSIDEMHMEKPCNLEGLLCELLKALDMDNPDPAESALVKLSTQLQKEKLAAIWADIRNFDFRSAETSTRSLATELGIALNQRMLSEE